MMATIPACPYYADRRDLGDMPCPCGCTSAERCYMLACKATSAAIWVAPRDQLNAVFLTGMADLGQSPQESVRYTHPTVDHGEDATRD